MSVCSSPVRRLGILAAVTLAAACVDGLQPMGPTLVDAVRLSATPVFSAPLLHSEAASLDRMRIVAVRASDGVALATVVQDLDPTASEWVVELSIELPTDRPTALRIQVELEGGGAVEWSGRTAAFEALGGVSAPEVRQVALYRGPVDNLSITGLRVDGPSVVATGQTGRLEAILVGGGSEARVFWASLDPGVVAVDSQGRMSAASEGSARIVATAGPSSDTLAIVVRDATLPTPEEVAERVAPGLEDVATRVTATLGDPAGAAVIATTLGDLAVALSGGDPAEAVRAFEAARAAWAGYGVSSGLRQLDAPLLGLVEIALIHAADALGIAFG